MFLKHQCQICGEGLAHWGRADHRGVGQISQVSYINPTCPDGRKTFERDHADQDKKALAQG